MSKRLIYSSGMLLVLSLASNAMAELVAYYSMDEGGGNVVADGSGNGHDGTAQNGNLVWTTGVSGSAVEFTGAGSAHVNCGTFNPSEGTGQFTISCWVNFAGDYGQYLGILCKRDAYTAGRVMWNLEVSNAPPNTLSVALIADGTPRIYSGYGPEVGTWVHLCVTYDGTTAILYVDGEEDSSNASMVFAGGEDATVRIGCNNEDGSNPFNGAIDEVYIFSTALAADEVVQLMDGELKPADLNPGAKKPVPSDGETDVALDTDLNWSPGRYAVTHDVYFGTNADDVNDASRSNPNGVLVSQGQSDLSYTPRFGPRSNLLLAR